MNEQPSQTRDDELTGTVRRERPRVLAFIRSRLPDRDEAEDIVSDVFYELVVAYRLQTPITHVSGWLFRVARNAVADALRKRKHRSGQPASPDKAGDGRFLPALFRSIEVRPDNALAREALVAAVERALNELPREQRDVFLAHECGGRSFREMSVLTGVPVNTLLSRKRYAVLSLRRSLRHMIED